MESLFAAPSVLFEDVVDWMLKLDGDYKFRFTVYETLLSEICYII